MPLHPVRFVSFILLQSQFITPFRATRKCQKIITKFINNTLLTKHQIIIKLIPLITLLISKCVPRLNTFFVKYEFSSVLKLYGYFQNNLLWQTIHKCHLYILVYLKIILIFKSRVMNYIYFFFYILWSGLLFFMCTIVSKTQVGSHLYSYVHVISF